MCKKVLFVTIVILLVTSMASAGGRSHKPKGPSQYQETYAGMSAGISICGTGAGSTQAGSSSYGSQSMRTRSGSASQSAASSIGGQSSGWSFWGAVTSWFEGYAYTEQKQSL